FNLSIGYNFGFKTESFKAPIFYLGEDDLPLPSKAPKVLDKTEEEMSDSLLMAEYVTYDLKDTFEFYTEPVYVVNRDTVIINEVDTLRNTTLVINNANINTSTPLVSTPVPSETDSVKMDMTNIVKRDTVFVRDTIYEKGTIIQEKVIIRTDTIREIIKEEIIRDTIFRSGGIEPVGIEKTVIVDATNVSSEIDTIITFDPVTNEKTIVVVEKSELPKGDSLTLTEIETVIDTIITVNPVTGLEKIDVVENELPKKNFPLNELENASDTIIMLDPVTLEQDTLFKIDGVVEETVPEEPIFTIEKLDGIEIKDVNSDLIAGYIGAPRVDLTQEEKVLNDVQESNFELVALRNEINELKVKDDRSQAEIDAIYAKLDEINKEYMSYDDYNNQLAVQANEDYNKPENVEVQTSTNLLRQDLSEVRSEVVFLETN
ncbi:MAG: hypothetical protein ACPG5P_06885, partial [Saprospiraceae bacterium]